jgi:hypothetical protein
MGQWHLADDSGLAAHSGWAKGASQQTLRFHSAERRRRTIAAKGERAAPHRFESDLSPSVISRLWVASSVREDESPLFVLDSTALREASTALGARLTALGAALTALGAVLTAPFEESTAPPELCASAWPDSARMNVAVVVAFLTQFIMCTPDRS